MSSNGSKNPKRIRTITWDDPKISARDAISISGLDYLRSIKMGLKSLNRLLRGLLVTRYRKLTAAVPCLN